MSFRSHRESADAARAAAATANLPNVRERELRSAVAYEALAAIDERTAARSNARNTEAAQRKAVADQAASEKSAALPTDRT